MDSTREHLWGQLLLERQVMAREDLARLMDERDHYARQGRDCSLGQLLVHKQRLDPQSAAALGHEVEGRGRVCYACRRIYLARQPNEPATCPGCGGSAALPPPGSGRRAAVGPAGGPASGRAPGASPQGFAAQAPGSFPAPSQGYAASGRFPAQPPPGSGRRPGVAPPGGPGHAPPAASPPPASGRHPAVPPGSGAWPATPPASGGRPAVPAAGYSPVEGDGLPAGNVNSLASGRWNAPKSTAPEGDGDISLEASSGEFGIGKRFGRYEILDEIGRGGMGVVYRVRDPSRPDAPLALKVLLAGEFASPKLMERFRDEAQMASRLRHPNIVGVYDAGDVDGLPYYAMDYIEGSELQDLIRDKSLSVRRGAEVLADVARAAHHAHEQGVIHRDLKPSNVLLAADGTPYIMDFGLAKNLESDKGLTRSGVAIGTPYYMPPEQARGNHREMDARSDVYALGAILYEVLTRRVPFSAKTQNELLRKIIEDEPTPPRQHRAGVPAPLATICLKALGKTKDARYDSALAFAEDLERFLAGRPIQARPPAFYKRWADLAKKHRTLAIAGAGATAVVLTATLVVVHFVSSAEAAAESAAQREEEQQEAYADSRSAVSVAEARRALERAERFLGRAVEVERELQPRGRPETSYQRGLVRRALCRWDAAAEDFRRAAEATPFAARANLARGLIRLRWGADEDGARSAFQRARADPSREPGGEADGAREERTAERIARGYLSYLDGDVPGARQRLRRALDGGGLAATANAALAYLARREGRGLRGGRVQSGLRRADLAVRADRYRYEYLVDRAILRARAERLEDALLDLRDARALCADGEMPDLAEAVVRAKQGRAAEMKEALRAARSKARQRPARVERRVSTFASDLERAARAASAEATPSRPERPPGRTPSGSRGRSGAIDGDTEAALHFTPSAQTVMSRIVVPEGVRGIRILLATPDRPIGVFVRHDARPTSPRDADYRTQGGGHLLLTMRRDGSPGLRSGTYYMAAHHPEPIARGEGFDVAVSVRFYRQGDEPPPDWKSLADLDVQVGPQRAENGDRFQRIVRRARGGDLPGAISAMEDLEAAEPDNAMLKLARAKWLLEAERTDEAREALEEVLDARPDVVLARLLRAQAATKTDELDVAVAHFGWVVERHPDVLEARLRLAETAYDAERYQAALDAASAVRERDPHLPRAGLAAALARIATGSLDEGVSLLEQSLQHLTVPVSTTVKAVEALVKRGRAEKALELVEGFAKRRAEAKLKVPLQLALAQGEALAAARSPEVALQHLRRIRGKVEGSEEMRRLVDRAIESIEAGRGGGGG